MQSKLKISFKREFPLTEVSLFYLPSNLKNIPTKVSSIARNKFSNKLKPSMRSGHPVRKISNNHFLVTSGKLSLITFSKCSCLLRDELKTYEIAFIASKTFLKPTILVRELTKNLICDHDGVCIKPTYYFATQSPKDHSPSLLCLQPHHILDLYKFWQYIFHCLK